MLALQFCLEDPGPCTVRFPQNYDVWVDDVALYRFADPRPIVASYLGAKRQLPLPQDRTYPGCTRPSVPRQVRPGRGTFIGPGEVSWVADGDNLRVISPAYQLGFPSTWDAVTLSEGMAMAC